MEFKEYKGKNVDEAITNACIDLGIEAAKLEYEVIEKGSNGFLGIGRRYCKRIFKQSIHSNGTYS